MDQYGHIVKAIKYYKVFNIPEHSFTFEKLSNIIKNSTILSTILLLLIKKGLSKP